MYTETRRGPAKIILGFDGSAGAVRAARWALDEAARTGAPVELCHVSGRTCRPADELLTQRAEDIVEQAALDAAATHPHVHVTTVCAHGSVASVLSRRSAGAELMVLGSRTGSRAGGPLGATTTAMNAMNANARCPVVVVRNVPGHDPVLVGVDDTEESELALAFAFEQAAAHGASLHAVHAWLPSIPAGRKHAADEILDAEWRSLTDLVDRWRQKYPSVKATHEVVIAHPAQALLPLSAQAGLVVVGTRDGRACRATLLGSVSHHLLRHAETSVAVVRETRADR
ncbi:universal stress protein [Actinoplanes sp. NPDC051633]|uniref:universal stress protein n=1 Tax=Actinoplanes sp. NPDC051633 TaxID=3155670 RepID=UPI00342AE7D1